VVNFTEWGVHVGVAISTAEIQGGNHGVRLRACAISPPGTGNPEPGLASKCMQQKLFEKKVGRIYCFWKAQLSPDAVGQQNSHCLDKRANRIQPALSPKTNIHRLKDFESRYNLLSCEKPANEL
jgi:hypothetical protein